MVLVLLVLLLALLLGGLGFAVHVLWWIALIVLVVWLLGFVLRVGEGGSRGRWYRWLPAGGGSCSTLDRAQQAGRYARCRGREEVSWRRTLTRRRCGPVWSGCAKPRSTPMS
jgi:hypothetical protein